MKNVRSIAIFPLFLASILMMALTVLPHHHHGEMICFSKSLGHHHDPEHHCGLNASLATEAAKSTFYAAHSVVPGFSALLSCIPQLPRLNDSERFVTEMEDYLKNLPFIENPMLSFVAEVRVLRDVPIPA